MVHNPGLAQQVPPPDKIASLGLKANSVYVRFAETAIMIMKALIFKDVKTYRSIKDYNVQPTGIKKLVRRVDGFDDVVWLSLVAPVAIEAVSQKFHKCKHLQPYIAVTKTKIIAETLPRQSRRKSIGPTG